MVFRDDLLLEALDGRGDWSRVGRSGVVSVSLSDTLVGEFDLNNDPFDLEIVRL